MRSQPLIAVANVRAAARWYRDVLGLRSDHGGDEYDQLQNDIGEIVLQLHRWDAHDHPLLGDEAIVARGNGSVLWFETEDFESVVAQVASAKATVVDGPLDNPLARHREIWLRDLDDYVVVVASTFGTI
jgi:catechol 2,3-dioxygenase-like lactoylglutathione lyase family enzyme